MCMCRTGLDAASCKQPRGASHGGRRQSADGRIEFPGDWACQRMRICTPASSMPPCAVRFQKRLSWVHLLMLLQMLKTGFIDASRDAAPGLRKRRNRLPLFSPPESISTSILLWCEQRNLRLPRNWVHFATQVLRWPVVSVRTTPGPDSRYGRLGARAGMQQELAPRGRISLPLPHPSPSPSLRSVPDNGQIRRARLDQLKTQGGRTAGSPDGQDQEQQKR